MIALPLLLLYWDYRYASPHLACISSLSVAVHRLTLRKKINLKQYYPSYTFCFPLRVFWTVSIFFFIFGDTGV
jgi:hypothetical protein